MEGTLAGPDVPLYSQAGYGWMKAFRKAKAERPVSWTYPYGGASLKIHTVPKGESREILFCLGEKGGEEMGKSRWEPFVIWRDESGGDPAEHSADFVTVLEPYEGSPFIRSVKPLEPAGDPVRNQPGSSGIEIRYADGLHRDILVGSWNQEKASFHDSSGNAYETDARDRKSVV